MRSPPWVNKLLKVQHILYAKLHLNVQTNKMTRNNYDDDDSNKVSRLNKILNSKYQKPISSKWDDCRIPLISCHWNCAVIVYLVSRPNKILNCRYQKPISSKARFKRHATAVPNSIDRIKFDYSTAVARLGFKRRATAAPNSIHKIQIH